MLQHLPVELGLKLRELFLKAESRFPIRRSLIEFLIQCKLFMLDLISDFPGFIVEFFLGLLLLGDIF